jgi:hypothetical protein
LHWFLSLGYYGECPHNRKKESWSRTVGNHYKYIYGVEVVISCEYNFHILLILICGKNNIFHLCIERFMSHQVDTQFNHIFFDDI